MNCYYYNSLNYYEARRIQESLVSLRRCDKIIDSIVYCEHRPALSFGKRTESVDRRQVSSKFSDDSVEIVSADRGGTVTYHCPGQIMIYPVISLVSLGMGVRRFTELGLKAIVKFIGSFNVESSVLLDPAGVWTRINEESHDSLAKIASVGLRINRGISNHGFSLNVCCDLEPFSRFNPCGVNNSVVTSIESEMNLVNQIKLEGEKLVKINREFVDRLHRDFCELLVG